MRPRFSPAEPPERPTDPAVRRANLRRVFGLFKAYRWRLSVVLALIGFSALLSIVSPFLVRDIFDEALPENDNRLLTILVLSRDGVTEPNLVWKDTVLLRTGETVDILLDVTNPGIWMAHCHIAEHHESGMMFSFEVTP